MGKALLISPVRSRPEHACRPENDTEVRSLPLFPRPLIGDEYRFYIRVTSMTPIMDHPQSTHIHDCR